jgi:hypothetical protein
MARRLTKAQLEGVVEVLKKPLRPEARVKKETPGERSLRLDARREAEARLREYRMAEASWEAYEDPAVRRLRNHMVNRATVEAETRARLRREVPEPEPASPARAALERSDDERQHELIWTQYTPNGWGAPDDDN